MNRDGLLDELQLFASFEVLQSTLYKRNVNAVSTAHWRNALRRFVDVEEGHVDRLRYWVHELGGEPLVAMDGAVRILGSLGAQALEVMGIDEVIRVGIAVENKASRMYNDLLGKYSTDDSLLSQMLWGNLVQEEMHALWLQQWAASHDAEAFQVVYDTEQTDKHQIPSLTKYT